LRLKQPSSFWVLLGVGGGGGGGGSDLQKLQSQLYKHKITFVI